MVDLEIIKQICIAKSLPIRRVKDFCSDAVQNRTKGRQTDGRGSIQENGFFAHFQRGMG